MEITNDKNFVVKHLGDRERVETVLNRADYLEPCDRALLNQVLGKDVKPSEVAVVIGVTTRSIQRRVQRLMERLTDDEVVFVLRNSPNWSESLAAAATMVWVHDKSMRETSVAMGASLHSVRNYVAAVRVLMREESDRAKRETTPPTHWSPNPESRSQRVVV